MSDVNAPSTTPILNSPPVRGARRVYSTINGGDEATWSHGGTVNPAALEIGPRWPAPYKLSLDSIWLTLGVVSNVNLTVGTRVNGSQVQTYTLNAGLLAAQFFPVLTLEANDFLQATLQAAPTGTGVGLGIIYRYTRTA